MSRVRPASSRWLRLARESLFPALLVALLTDACRSPTSTRSNLADTSVYVAPDGDDGSAGTRESPFRSIRRALANGSAERILLRAGRYAEGAMVIRRPVAIFGPGGAEAKVESAIKVAADDVLIHGISLEGSLAAEGVRRLVVRDANLVPDGVVSTVYLAKASASFVHVAIDCGSETCVSAQTATVSLEGADLRPPLGGRSRRGIAAETSSVTARALLIEGTDLAQIGVSARSSLTLSDAILREAGGNGLTAIEGSTVFARRTAIAGSNEQAIVASESRLAFHGGSLGPGRAQTIGVLGGRLVLVDVALEASREGVLNLAAVRRHAPEVFIRGGTIRLGRSAGPRVGEGRLQMIGTRIVAQPDPSAEDAISAIGGSAELSLFDVTIENASGFGVAAYEGADLLFRGKIVKPRKGGVLVENGAGARVRLESAVVEGCAGGSGIELFGTTEAELRRIDVRGCSDAGLVAGEGATVKLSEAHLRGNAQYGVAAFGGAELSVGLVEVEGSPWAAFASCAEGSGIVEFAQNRFDGPTVLCR